MGHPARQAVPTTNAPATRNLRGGSSRRRAVVHRAHIVARLLLVLSCLPIGNALLADPSPPPVLSKAQNDLARKIKAEIMAPCCWNGTVDTHESAIANQIARDIDHRVAAGETEAQIVDRLVAQYGERILARPRTRGLGLVFYVFPILTVVSAGIGLAVWMSRSARGGPTPAGGAEAGLPTRVRKEAHPQDLEARFEAELRRLQER